MRVRVVSSTRSSTPRRRAPCSPWRSGPPCITRVLTSAHSFFHPTSPRHR